MPPPISGLPTDPLGSPIPPSYCGSLLFPLAPLCLLVLSWGNTDGEHSCLATATCHHWATIGLVWRWGVACSMVDLIWAGGGAAHPHHQPGLGQLPSPPPNPHSLPPWQLLAYLQASGTVLEELAEKGNPPAAVTATAF